MKIVIICLIIYFVVKWLINQIIKTRKDHYDDYLNRHKKEDSKPF